MRTPTTSRITRYLTVILRWLVITFVVFVLTILGGTYITDHLLPKVYTATAQIQIRPHGVTGIQALLGPGDRSDPFQGVLETMESPEVLLPVISDLGLDKAWAKRLFKSKDLPANEALAYMRKILKIEVKRGTNLIEITASSDMPKEAADIVNAIADRYKTMRDVEEYQRNDRAEDALREQIAQQQKLVDEKKAEVEKLRQDLSVKGIQIPGGDGMTNIERTETALEARKKDLLAAQEDYDARQVVLHEIQSLPDNKVLGTVLNLPHVGPTAADLCTKALKLEEEISNLLKSGFPMSEADLKEALDKRKQLNDIIARLRRAMQVDTEMAKSRVALLPKEVDDLTAKLRQDQTAQLQPFRNAQRDLEQQQSILEALTVRLKQNIADSQLQEDPVRVISRAEIPTVPTKPNKTFNLIVTILVAGFLSVVAASFVEMMLLVSRASERPDN